MNRYLRLIGAGALTFAVALTAGAALAQPPKFVGGYMFQTNDLDPGPEANIISGHAVVRQKADGAYDIALNSTEFLETETGSPVRVYAIQTCTGQMKGAEIEIFCEVLQASELDYPASNFRLKYVPGTSGMWRGTTPMDAETEVEFIALPE